MSLAAIEQALEEELAVAPAPLLAAAPAPPVLGDAELDDALEGAVARLHALREDYADVSDDEVLDSQFYWRILGGAWTAKHKAVAADTAAMYARAHARCWCDI